jgi:hypothetical protein
VIGERKTAFDNCVALTPECQRRFVKQFEMTEHLRQFRVIGCQLSHQLAPIGSADNAYAAGSKPTECVYPDAHQPKHRELTWLAQDDWRCLSRDL